MNVFSVLERETPEFIHVFNACHRIVSTYYEYVPGILLAMGRYD